MQRACRAETSRRDFLATSLLGSAAALSSGVLASCHARKRGAGTASNAQQAALVLPRYTPHEFLAPDIAGEGPIPGGYLKYPTDLARAIREKPASGGRPIKAMTPAWGPTPPSLGRNSYLAAVNASLGIALDSSVQDGLTFGQKLSAILGARDVPELLAAPSWEIGKIPRFSQAVKALFEDLTDYLKGDAVSAYPMLATLPTTAWQYCVWGGRLAAVPYPTDGPFPWALFYRKDLTDQAGIAAPRTIDELYHFGKATTNAERGTWAFGNVFEMVQMLFKCSGVHTGWRKKSSNGLEHKYETKEYAQAVAFAARLYREGLVHPDVIASNGADAVTLLNAGKMLMTQDGLGMWRNAQSEQAKITPGFNLQPLPLFSAVGGDPLAWADEGPIFYTFIRKGLGKERTREILRVLNWCAAPFGTEESQLRQYGVEGKHFTRAADNSPIPTDLGRKEIALQYDVLGGRVPSLVGTADVPHFVEDLLHYSRTTYRYREENPFIGLKLEYPPSYSKAVQSAEDQINDLVRGRRPLADLTQIVEDWRNGGGDEGRAFFEKALADNGR